MKIYTKRTKKQERLMGMMGDNPFHPRFITTVNSDGVITMPDPQDTDNIVWQKWDNRRPLIINNWRIYVGNSIPILVNIKEWIME